MEQAANLMSNPEAVDDALALRFLSWLLTVSSDHALAVTQVSVSLSVGLPFNCIRSLQDYFGSGCSPTAF